MLNWASQHYIEDKISLNHKRASAPLHLKRLEFKHCQSFCELNLLVILFHLSTRVWFLWSFFLLSVLPYFYSLYTCIIISWHARRGPEEICISWQLLLEYEIWIVMISTSSSSLSYYTQVWISHIRHDFHDFLLRLRRIRLYVTDTLQNRR